MRIRFGIQAGQFFVSGGIEETNMVAEFVDQDQAADPVMLFGSGAIAGAALSSATSTAKPAMKRGVDG